MGELRPLEENILNATEVSSDSLRLYFTAKSWIEGDALQQFKRAAALDGVCEAAALPDLHPGRGLPVGAAFLSNGFIHPMLIGSDAGCGMALYQSDMSERKLKKDRFVKTLGDNPAGLLKETAERIMRSGAVEAEPDPEGMLGSIGHGNHFAELLAVDEI